MLNVEQRQEVYKRITETLANGGVVIVSTYTRATKFSKPQHVKFFDLRPNGLYAQYGKNWLCIDGCAFRFGHKA